MKTREAALTRGVAKAITEFEQLHGKANVHVAPSACGGAFLEIRDVPLGLPYHQDNSWVGFFLTNACPEADTYPFYVRGDLSRVDGKPLKSPIHINREWPDADTTFPKRPAVMISRRQNNAASLGRETPARKLLHVLKWLLEQ